jgi:hypothetical protein
VQAQISRLTSETLLSSIYGTDHHHICFQPSRRSATLSGCDHQSQARVQLPVQANQLFFLVSCSSSTSASPNPHSFKDGNSAAVEMRVGSCVCHLTRVLAHLNKVKYPIPGAAIASCDRAYPANLGGLTPRSASLWLVEYLLKLVWVPLLLDLLRIGGLPQDCPSYLHGSYRCKTYF